MHLNPSFFEIVFTLVLFFLLSFSYKKLNKSLIFTPINPTLLVLSITCTTIIMLNRLNYIPDTIFNVLMIEFFIYYFFILIAPFFIRIKADNLYLYFNERDFDHYFLKIIFYISTLIGIIYISLFWSNYSDGNDRLVFNRDFRLLMLINQLFSFWCIGLSSILFVKTKRMKYLIYFLITLILIIFMGSKAQAVISFLWFMFFYIQFNKINNIKLIIFSFIIFILFLLPTYIMYDDAVEILINRVFLSADIYIWSFIIGNYEELKGFYDPIKYLLHPFSSIFGIRGYEYPFGSQILETAGISPEGKGPQDHMLILGLLFYEDNSTIYLFTFIFAFLTLISIIFTFYFLRQTKIHLSFRILVLVLFYSRSIGIFIGVNAYSFNIIILLCGTIFYLFILLLKNILTKRTNLYDQM